MKFDWNGKVIVNGQEQAGEFDVTAFAGQRVVIELLPPVMEAPKMVEPAAPAPITPVEQGEKEYRITVKKYMTEPATPRFDFMEKWNGNNPMPLRMMTGTIEKETRGMVYMHLHGDMYATQMCTCMRCGRVLTNPVSQYFGIGPECGGHNYVNPFDDEEQLKEAVAEYRKKLQQIQWSGWVIKSAITEQEEV